MSMGSFRCRSTAIWWDINSSRATPSVSVPVMPFRIPRIAAMNVMSARRDIVLIAFIAAVAAFLCVKFNLSEALLAWTRPFERFQLDEVPTVLFVIAVCLVWFSSRRYFEAIRQLHLRRAVEARLA